MSNPVRGTRGNLERKRAQLEAELEQLGKTRATLEAQLYRVNNALNTVKNNPDVEAVVDSISEAL